MYFLKFFLLIFGLCTLASNPTLAVTKVLDPSDNLEAEIKKSKAGDTLLLRPGTYNGGLTITNKRATSNNPIMTQEI